MPEFNKQRWSLFKLDRSNHNKADARISKILNEVYEKGKRDGKKEQTKLLKILINNAL
ncbi:MAG TPA: hypothetical protein VK172_10355 [Lentimicrobium sp.]|nr:hypothetical protein [Lentimicrobium sp.]